MLHVTCMHVGVIRVSEEVHEELRRLKKKLGAKSMSELILMLIRASSKELDRFNGNERAFLETLRYAGKAGKYDSERVDELLYGEET